MIINLNDANYEEIIEKGSKPVVLDIYATWCGPCIQMKPHFEALSEELGAQYLFADLNVDESRDLALKFNATSVPTLVFIKDNMEVGRKVGYLSKEDLQKAIEEFLG